MSEYNPNYLDFEQPLLDIENQIIALKTSANASQKDLKKIDNLKISLDKNISKIFSSLSDWQISQIARHPLRPYTLDYIPNLTKIKPDYVVHGDDWKKGHMSIIRRNSIKALKSYGGKLIELPYTKGISSAALIDHQNSITITPDIRRATLRKLLDAKNISRFLEAHNPISALIGENIYMQKNGKKIGFDGFWSSSLTDSTMMGKPDNESVDISQRLQGVNQIFDVTTKPLIFDGDTGGKIEHFRFTVRSLERLGVSAIVIEDKIGVKNKSVVN